ncbi:chimeric ERCC6-PGBD3 protein [Trichonephila clavata]|uniref:Chimeric ERCC6-PGBD3 protein n=1 Tax=Trichonephila clavata TaxID=2740835 RepID=A0A8X6K7W1_TRICU|nr:chimeric ERCC6-PGBD3 protein [Trichonephila clavata]
MYNHFMGSLDRADENIDKYPEAIRHKKYNSHPLLFCSELLLQNARLLHKTYDAKPMDLLESCRRVACHYLQTYGNPAEPGLRRKPSGKRNIDSRQESYNHQANKLRSVP